MFLAQHTNLGEATLNFIEKYDFRLVINQSCLTALSQEWEKPVNKLHVYV